MTDDNPEESNEDSPQAIKNALRDFQASGAAIAVTGQVGPDALQAHSRFALGTPKKRKQVLGLSRDCRNDTGKWLPNGLTPSSPTVRVVRRTDFMRSATPDGGIEPEQFNTLRAYRAGLTDAIDSLADAYTLDANDLRVLVTGTPALVDEHGADDTRQFIQRLSRYVKCFDGVVYFHLTVDRDSYLLDSYRNLFDARNELRYSRSTEEFRPEYRWHLTDTESTTDWFDLVNQDATTDE